MQEQLALSTFESNIPCKYSAAECFVYSMQDICSAESFCRAASLSPNKSKFAKIFRDFITDIGQEQLFYQSGEPVAFRKSDFVVIFHAMQRHEQYLRLCYCDPGWLVERYQMLLRTASKYEYADKRLVRAMKIAKDEYMKQRDANYAGCDCEDALCAHGTLPIKIDIQEFIGKKQQTPSSLNAQTFVFLASCNVVHLAAEKHVVMLKNTHISIRAVRMFAGMFKHFIEMPIAFRLEENRREVAPHFIAAAMHPKIICDTQALLFIFMVVSAEDIANFASQQIFCTRMFMYMLKHLFIRNVIGGIE